jgi:serine/threonine-protein kinase
MQQAQQLGRYHLLDRVAFGGMAEIYRAKTADAQGRLHLVAVKRVLAHLCEDDEFIQMLIDEARLTAMLKHPNIARVYEFCRTPNEYFISMEYVDGKDLRALLEKARQNQEWLPEDHIAHICMYVARGLHAAHMQTDRQGNPLNIVHRDVSPSNVLLSYGGEVKLCDFGIAKASSSRSQTKTGVIKGKVKYMSPEQAMGRRLDRRSDLFSLGTLLYEMLALQAPFSAGTEIELLFAVRDARMRPIRELRPHLNSDLEIIIQRAMAKSRSQRFQSGEEFAASLQAFLDTYYPNHSTGQLSRYLLKTFEREREREQRTLEEYVISSGSAESVGENLLADVLGPDAEYTQFTAAFSQNPSGVAEFAPSSGSVSNAPNPMQQMRVLSSVSMSGIEEIDSVPTLERQRMSAQDMGLSAEEATPFLPSAQTMPRGQSAVAAPASGGKVESGFETAILQQATPPRGMPSVQSEATAIVGEQPTNLLYDDGLHAQETAILSRQQVDAFLARRGLSVQPQGQAQAPAAAQPQPTPYGLADEQEFHDASTQILSMNSLPKDIRELLQKKVAGVGAAGSSAPVAAPVAEQPALPSLKLQPLDADFHEASTAYLDWSPIPPAQHSELPMPDPSAVHPARPLRPPTGAQPLVTSPGRSATGAQPLVTPPGRSVTGAQAPVAPAPPPSQARTTPAAIPQVSAPRPAPPPLSTPHPAAAPPLSTPHPAPAPSLNAPRPAPPSPLLSTPRPAMTPPLSTPRPTLAPQASPPRPAVEEPLVPAPRVAAPVVSEQILAPGPGLGTGEEWESLPHLESTMIARSAPPIERPAPAPRAPTARHDQIPLSPAPRAPTARHDQIPLSPAPRAPTARHDQIPLSPAPRAPTARHDQIPLSPAPRAPTSRHDQISPPAQPPAEPPRPAAEDMVERTLNTEEENLPVAAGQFEDLPTPVKNVPALRDLGIDSHSDFAEDTSKSGMPRGLSPHAHHVDAGQYLNDDDLEPIE